MPRAKSPPAKAPALPVKKVETLEQRKPGIIAGALLSLAAGQSLRSFCLANNLAYATTWEWLNPQGGDNSAYTRAREIGTHYLADECLDIADGIYEAAQSGAAALAERLKGIDPALIESMGVKLPDIGDLVKVARVRIDTRKQLIGKWNEKDYGDKRAVAVSGNLSVDQALAGLDDDE